MSRVGKGVWFSTLAALMFLVVASFLAIRPNRQVPASTSDVAAQVPPAVGTYDLLPTWTRSPPEPTRTPTPLPPPPAVRTMPPAPGQPPNIAWGSITDNSLTLWAGRYSDSPSPALTGARAVAHWSLALDVMSMAASPDGRYLALLTQERCFPPTPTPTPAATATPVLRNGTPVVIYPRTSEYCLGDFPRYLYVVDLLTNEVRIIPNYSDRDLYLKHGPHFSQNRGVLGWLDNDRIALDAGQYLVATRDGTSFQYRNFPNLTGRESVFMNQLLPDRKTMFVWVNHDFYLRDVHSGDIRKVGKRSQAKDARYGIIKASPNGQYISYVGPDVQSGGTSGRQLNLSFQRFSDDSRHLLVSGGVWDPSPAWSPDSSRIALVRTMAVPAGNNASIFESESADTDIYLATLAGLQVRRLTSFPAAHNRDIQWTPGGNLLVASTYGSRNKAFGLVWVSTMDGSAVRLWTPPPGETFAQSTLFEAQPSGMPPAGVDPAQP